MLELGTEALEVGDGGLDKVGGLGEDIHFDAAVSAGEGEIGAAEQEKAAIHYDEFFVEGLVGAAPEEGLDAVLSQFIGEIGIGAAHGGRGRGAVFGEDDDLDTGGGFLAERGIKILNGGTAAVAEVVGGNPDAFLGGASGIEEGLAEGFGGQEADIGGDGALARLRAAESRPRSLAAWAWSA